MSGLGTCPWAVPNARPSCLGPVSLGVQSIKNAGVCGRKFGDTRWAGSSDPDVDFTAVWSMVASPFAAKGFGKWLISTAPEGLCKLLTLFGDLTGAHRCRASLGGGSVC